MDSKEFSQIRRHLAKTQNQLARLLSVSPKAIQSFEQGWRNIPPHTERQLLFLFSLKKSLDENVRSCWEARDCPQEVRVNCPAWEFHAGHICWFINGTICEGTMQNSWSDKMKLCRQCEVFRSMFPPV